MNKSQNLQQRKSGEFFFAPKDQELLTQKGILVNRNKEGKLLEIKKVEEAFSGHVGEPFGCRYVEKPYVPSGACLKFDSNGKVLEIGELYSECHRCVDDDVMWLWKSYYDSCQRYNSKGVLVEKYRSSPRKKFITFDTLDKDIVSVLNDEGLLENVKNVLTNSTKIASHRRKPLQTRSSRIRG